MKQLSYHFLLILLTSLFLSCGDSDDDSKSLKLSSDFTVFASFYYGSCVGNCTEAFVINDQKLYKINNIKYFDKGQQYDENNLSTLEPDKYDLVKDLPQSLPQELLTSSETHFGCPDCADGGGVYIETQVNGELKHWYLDNLATMTPGFVQVLVARVNADIGQLTQ